MPFKALRGGSPKRKPRPRSYDVMPEHALMGQMLKDHGFVLHGKPDNKGSSGFGKTTYYHPVQHDYVEVQHRDWDSPPSKYGSGYRVASAGDFTFRPSTSYNAMGTRVPRKSVKIMRDDEPTTSSPKPDEPPPHAGMMALADPTNPQLHSWAAQATAPEPTQRGRGPEALRSALHKFGHRGKLESTESHMRLNELFGKPDAAKDGLPKGEKPSAGAPEGPMGTTQGKTAKKPGDGPPELPKGLDPASVHSYYMSMADYHDKKSWTNKRLSGFKPLWSDDRTMHDDKHLFHKAMRDGFAQKALAVDLMMPMDGASGTTSGFAGGAQRRESTEGQRRPLIEAVLIEAPEKIEIDHRTLTLEQFLKAYGESPLSALRSGRISKFTITNVTEAFGGTAPTGALDAVTRARSFGPAPLKSAAPAKPLRQPNPPGVPKIPGMPKMGVAREAVQAVSRGASPSAVIEQLLRK